MTGSTSSAFNLNHFLHAIGVARILDVDEAVGRKYQISLPPLFNSLPMASKFRLSFLIYTVGIMLPRQ